jgi:hypothetical protein
MKSVLMLGLAALSFAAAPAGAATFAAVGDSYTAYINGFTDDYLGGTTAVPGLLAELTFTLTGFSGKFANFDYSVKNVSVAPITSSAVKVFAFNVGNATVVGGSSATGDYSTVVLNNGQGFPNVGGINRTFELCFNSGNAGNCSGGGNGGTEIGETDVGALSIKLSSAISSITLNNFGVRWQELGATGIQIGGSGVGDEYTPDTPDTPVVPEPATWTMLIAGFGLVGATMRRRRGIASVSA